MLKKVKKSKKPAQKGGETYVERLTRQIAEYHEIAEEDEAIAEKNEAMAKKFEDWEEKLKRDNFFKVIDDKKG